MRGLVAVVSLMLMLPLAAWGVIETYEFNDPVLEDRYHELSQELRCPKCQNQNIADSNAPICHCILHIFDLPLYHEPGNNPLATV